MLLACIMILGLGGSNVTLKAAVPEDKGVYVGNIYVTADAVKCIEENGINIEDCDHIELIESVENGRSMPVTALRVAEKEEDVIIDHIIVAYEEDEKGNVEATDVPFTELKKTRENATFTIDWSPKKSLIIITGTTRYTVLGDMWSVYFKPEAVEFVYKKNQSCTVNSINVSFQTEGTLCDLDGNKITEEYVHYIEKYTNSPTEGVLYQQYKRLMNNHKILYTANINSGMFLTMEATVNGSLDGRTYKAIKVGN